MCRRQGMWLLVVLAGAECAWAGCRSVAEVDIQSTRICVASPSESALVLLSRGLSTYNSGLLGSLPPDAGVGFLAGISIPVVWESTVRFNDVVAQMPSKAVDISLDIRLLSITLSGTADLSFISGMQLSLRGAPVSTDGGARTTLSKSASECWKKVSGIPVAIYVGQGVPSGPAVELVSLVPNLNLFDCFKDLPVILSVAMELQPSLVPTTDAQLTLSTCVSAQATASYP
jgi:hypothetical protein